MGLLAVWCFLVPGAVALASPSPLASFSSFLSARQTEIIAAVEELDGSGEQFCSDAWSRADGSHGLTRVLQGGEVVEKGCVSTSFVKGELTPQRAEAMSARGRAVCAGDKFEAAALSIVLHARSPMVPTFRSDARVFVVESSEGGSEFWFGGGADLTPCYVFEEDAVEFHAAWKAVCDRHRAGLYAEYKKQCDAYFYLPFRGEHRGVGGIFFDDLAGGGDFDAHTFARDVVTAFFQSWLPIVQRRRAQKYEDKQRQWQLLRRGRYLEFNLMNDRGVRFGLSPDAIERVMVSAPPLIAWDYKNDPDPGSDEAILVDVLKHPKDWIPLH